MVISASLSAFPKLSVTLPLKSEVVSTEKEHYLKKQPPLILKYYWGSCLFAPLFNEES